MKNLFVFYKIVAKQFFLLQLQYRVATCSWLIGKILEPLIYLIIWMTVSNQSNGEIGGLNTKYFLSYYIILMVVNQLTFTDLIWRFGTQINSGDFSKKLILPVHPFHYDMAENIGYKLFSMPVILIVAILIAEYFGIVLKIDFYRLTIFVFIVVCSFLLRFLLEWTISLSSFWFDNAKGISSFYFVILLFFSGRVMPLDIFPAYLKQIANYLPFRFMVSYPVEILLKGYNNSYIIKNTCIQFFWLIIILFIMMRVYNLGIKKYTSV